MPKPLEIGVLYEVEDKSRVYADKSVNRIVDYFFLIQSNSLGAKIVILYDTKNRFKCYTLAELK